MKRILFLLLILLVSISGYAKGDNTTYGKVIEASNSIILKNNSIVKCNSSEESNVSLTIQLDDNTVVFTPCSKVIINDKIFLIGIGNYNVHIICIDGNNICIPISKTKKVVVNSKAITNYLKNNIDEVPENNDILANI